MVEKTILSMIDKAINGVLKLDPKSKERLQVLTGKVVGVDVLGWNKTFYLQFDDQGAKVILNFEGEPNTMLRGKPQHLFKLASEKHSAEVIMSGEVDIQGDVEVGKATKALLAEMDINWEGHLAKFTGEEAAKKITDVVRKGFSWGKDTVTGLVDASKEFLHEETDTIPTLDEADEFYKGVDELRDSVARLKKRVDEIEGT